MQQIAQVHPQVFENEGTVTTCAEARIRHEQMRATFPDIHYQIEEIFVAGNRVVVRWLACATQQGNLWVLIPPTGKPAAWPGMHIVRVETDKIVEIWGVANQTRILQQLGVRLLPPTSESQ